MIVLKDLKQIPCTKEMVLREAERKLVDQMVNRRIRTRWQLRKTLAGMGALGLALKASAGVKAMEVLMSGSWVPRSWA